MNDAILRAGHAGPAAAKATAIASIAQTWEMGLWNEHVFTVF